jgi:predicted AAA+ superfamily ATPase
VRPVPVRGGGLARAAPGAGHTRGDWRAEARIGGYPTPALHLDDPDDRELWFAGYTQTYLERDLRDLANVASLVDFRRLMRAACLRAGNLANQTELGRDVGLSQSTVHRHLDLLEASHQLVRPAPYSVNRTKRLIKTPKLYWSDVGLALHLAGESELRGAHLETLVLTELLAWRDSQPRGPQVLTWRTSGKQEVDFVVEWKDRLLPIEVKSAERGRRADAQGLRTFRRSTRTRRFPACCFMRARRWPGSPTELLQHRGGAWSSLPGSRPGPPHCRRRSGSL